MKKAIRSIEGFRALAFIAVSLYHLYPHHFPGGFLGVVSFFAIAGFFISLPYARKEAKPLLSHFRSRFLKLMPPLLLLLFSISLWSYFVQPLVFLSVKKNLLPTLVGVNNYAQLFSGFSYFEQHGNFNPFVHLWALSVEMQFYVFFPLLLKKLEKLHRSKIINLLLGITLFSSLYMIVIYLLKGAGFAYYSSLARLLSFSTASLFAFVFVPVLDKKSWNFPAKTPLQLLLMAILLSWVFLFEGDSKFLYLGGFLLYSIMNSLLLVLLFHDGGLGAKLLQWKPLLLLGKRSYSLYLWQYSLMILFAHGFSHRNFPYILQVLLQLVLVFVLGELSYRYFEKKRPVKLFPLLLLLTLLLPMVLPTPVVKENLQAQLEKQIADLKRQKQVALQQEYGAPFNDYVQVLIENDELKIHIPSILDQPPQDERMEYIKKSNKDFPQHLISLWDYRKYRAMEGIALGDSVMITGGVKLQQLLPNFVVDASISRQFYEAPELIKAHLAEKPNTKVIVIGLGTNRVAPLNKDMEELVKVAQGRKILLINTISPDPQEKHINNILKGFADKYPEVSLIDWYSLAKNKNEYFYDDSTHLHPDGAKFYTHILLKAILEAAKN